MSDIAALSHIRKKLPGNGQVVVLDTGSAITSENCAMLQALHSRSTAGIDDHLEVLAKRDSAKFMSTYYVGYGHKSIGDCGNGTVFVEGVSMLAAKAIQDGKLYAGQESSTRYIDFAKQTFVNPLASSVGEAVLEGWRAFYLKVVSAMPSVLKERYPKAADESEAVYNKAIAARAFDTARGWLPAGATTNLAWHGSLRQFADRLSLLRHHPLAEVKAIATAVEEALLEAFPNSFSDKRYQATESYNALAMQSYYHHDPNCPELTLTRNGLDGDELATHRELLATRPAKTELPKWLGSLGEVGFALQLDFGSFRDLQRHRAITQRMPLLTSQLGFEPWYLEELPDKLRAEATALLDEQKTKTEALSRAPEMAQYYLPMGYRVSNAFSGDLPALVYLVELRATRFVHPTLREQAARMATILSDTFGASGLTIHLDPERDRFDSARGTHDIVKTD